MPLITTIATALQDMKQVIPRSREAHIRRAIRSAPMSSIPFPHLVVDRVLPPSVHADALRNWPTIETMKSEPGDLDRYMAHLATDAEALRAWGEARAKFWAAFTSAELDILIKEALGRFHLFNELRFGKDHAHSCNPVLFEAGPNFRQHGPHTHCNHNPDWIMTFLLFVDDGGREDRGEVLSAPLKGTPWLDIVSGSSKVQTRPIKHIAFRSNRLVAWLDGPMSYHGTDLLDPGTTRRRIIRGHVSVPHSLFEQRCGVSVADFFAATQLHHSGESSALGQILQRPGNCVEALPKFFFAAD